MAHYENCDPESQHKRYCIFHKPDKDAQEALEFYRKFLEYFKPRVKERLSHGQKIKYLVFEGPLNCQGYVFPEIPDEPIHYTDPEGALWEQPFSFRYAEFKGDLNFLEAVFKGDVSFLGAKFEGNVSFMGTIFEGTASFMISEFSGTAEFIGTTFKKMAIFLGTFFKSHVTIFGVKFHDFAEFSESIILGNASIDYVYFEVPPKIINPAGRDGTIMSPAELLRTLKIRYSEQSLSMIAKLQRLAYERFGDRERADTMFVVEMRAKREYRILYAKGRLLEAKGFGDKLKALLGYIKTWLGAQLEKIIADWTCEYGTNWKRILLVSAAMILVFALFYAALAEHIAGFPQGRDPATRFAYGLYLSAITFATLSHGDLTPTGWVKALNALEALIGAGLTALFVVVVARKWMR